MQRIDDEEKINELIHILNDDNLNLLYLCALCKFALYNGIKIICASRNVYIDEVSYCKQRDVLLKEKNNGFS